jgi:hypothetical protein
MDPFARISETHHEMSELTRHLRLVESSGTEGTAEDTSVRTLPGGVAVLQEWRAAQIARSKAMHPSTLGRAAAAPALRPLG